MDEVNDVPLMQSSVSKRIWALMESHPEQFRQEVKDYFARAYPGFTVVRAKYPVIYLRDDRDRMG
ncbi:hypothetical protein CF651_18945 [Paenibacillus rigui]|uniref:Uncharacterized protein n=1 Tax=Paenibacillus rigui TaxID=554312 RepID=A0A229UMB1_9BACL|nr:hypothetical protein CF651_18945 [Paenibacillus rigui]